jgi:hypothetical protein
MDQQWIYGPDDLYGISAYLQLIQRWVATAFPQPRDQETVIRLTRLWVALGWTLHGRATDEVANEIAKLLATREQVGESSQQDLEQLRQQLRTLVFAEEIEAGQAGDPPVHGLEQRLRTLAADVREGFLAVAMREATEFYIARSLPAALDQWRQLADQLVPRSLWYISSHFEILPKLTIYGPDS